METTTQALPRQSALRAESIDDLLKEKHGQKVSGAEAVTLTMISLNTLLFGLPGGAVLPLDQRAAQYADYLRYFLVKHEAHATFAAGGYGAIKGYPAFSLVTSGALCGVINSLTGVYNSLMEFEPSVIVSGNVPLPFLENPDARAFQCSKTVECAKALSKYAVLVKIHMTSKEP